MARPKNSSGSVYIFSTLACDQKYQNYEINSGIAIPTQSISVAGGTGIMDERFVTPLGVMTAVSEDDYAALQINPDFQLHVKNGFIVVQKQEADPEKVAADMNMEDPARPITQDDSRMALASDATVTTNVD